MKKTALYNIIIGVFGSFFMYSTPVFAQEEPDSTSVQPSASQLFAKGDSLRRAYSFAQALRAYESAAAVARDSVEHLEMEEAAMLARNGLNMLDFCSNPSVIARQKFSKEEFFLYYPLADGSWRPIPNALDSIKTTAPVSVTYIPEGSTRIFYSAADADGIRNLYNTSFADSLWTAPELLGELLTSSGNEIFPMLSPDGQSIYFASDGLFGMGGYDLYVSRWNKEQQEWEVPTNLGFPYSSPFDDYLYINTADGKYSIFASNRECGADSVYVYVLDYDSTPIRRSCPDDSQDIRELASLIPCVEAARVDNTEAVSGDNSQESESQRLYISSMLEVKSLRDSINTQEQKLDSAREQLVKADEAVKNELSGRIVLMEQELRAMEDSLALAVRLLQKLEMDIILSGQVIDPDKVLAMAERDVKGAAEGYTFSAHRLGAAPEMTVAKPVSKFDYSFMILPEGRFAEDNTLPGGIVYQIQLFQTSKPATVQKLKGLSPVFWQLGPNQRYTYYAGLFRTYKDVLANLNKVKKAGFKNAFIVAFNNGKTISVAAAKKMENATAQ